MLNRLEKLLNFKDVYPKLFVKLQKAGGEKQLDIDVFASQIMIVLYTLFFYIL